jgi:hypothetical protein
LRPAVVLEIQPDLVRVAGACAWELLLGDPQAG